MRPKGARTVLVAVSILAACDSSESEARADDRAADIYATVVRWLTGTDASAVDEPVVFVESATADEIDIELQVAVIERLDDYAAVRFIDEREEAIEDAPPNGVRDDGVLVALGLILDEGTSTVTVYAERYRQTDDHVAFRVMVDEIDGQWQVSGATESVDVRPRPP